MLIYLRTNILISLLGSITEKQTSKEEEVEEVKILSEKELNVLGAKLLKAEMLGNDELAQRLKLKLEKAREAKNNPNLEPESETVEEVVLTRTDSKGMSRPIDANTLNAKFSGQGKRRKKEKVETHESGKRKRYFADDDR